MGDTRRALIQTIPKPLSKGKKKIVPLVNRIIPVIEDDYVDIEFGSEPVV